MAQNQQKANIVYHPYENLPAGIKQSPPDRNVEYTLMRMDCGPHRGPNEDSEGLALYTTDEDDVIWFHGWIRRRASPAAWAYGYLFPLVANGADVRVMMPPSRSANGGFDDNGVMFMGSATWRIVGGNN